MLRRPFNIFFALLTTLALAQGQDDLDALAGRHWFETHSAHFNTYSCAPTQDVYKVVARLEQFRKAYSLLAGAQAVTSPSINVMVFPDQPSMQPFLPQYNGKPANLAGFFMRTPEDNMIVMSLSGTNSGALNTIFHEYTHLLFRHNARIWPLWLNEGMAEIYSTFDATGRGVRIGKPIAHHLRLLKQSELMPLAELLSITTDSPQYNETDHQGVFYAESWLLTHFLMNGDNPTLKTRFSNFMKLLKAGVPSEKAFTQAMQMPLSSVEAELRRYLQRGQFESIACVVSEDLSAPRAVTPRNLTAAETSFRLGSELLLLRRLDAVEPYFVNAKKFAPDSPLPHEGLGLLAAARDQHDEAIRQLKIALDKHSASHLAHYVYARELFDSASDSPGKHYVELKPAMAAEVRAELQKALMLMPDYGPAHHLLGILELVQREDLASAEQHLQRAIQLEPENQWYLLSLAQAQFLKQDSDAARRTLEPLRLPYVAPKLRALANEALDEINRDSHGKPATQ